MTLYTQSTLGGSWESSMLMVAWWAHKTRTGWNTWWTSWLASSDGMASLPTLPIYARWRANPAYYGQGCMRRPRLWSAWGWDTSTRWDYKNGSHACNVELSSPRCQWRNTADAFTGRNPQSTGSGFWSFRRSTNPRCTTWALQVQLNNAPAPSPAARVPPTREMACACTLASRTGGIGSGSCRNTPTTSPSASAMGAKSQQGY